MHSIYDICFMILNWTHARVEAVLDQCFKASNASRETAEEADQDIQGEPIRSDLIAEEEVTEDWLEEDDYAPADVVIELDIEFNIGPPREVYPLAKKYKL